MTDLTKITTPFGLLDKATQEALRYHWEGGMVEYYSSNGWKGIYNLCWLPNTVYRAKPEPVRVDFSWAFYENDNKGRTVKIGYHAITCNPDGTEPTVTWEPSE